MGPLTHLVALLSPRFTPPCQEYEMSIFINLILCFSGFREYLQTGPHYDFPSYRELVHNITQTFNNISNEVIDIEKKVRESGQSAISEVIRKLQLKEKEKLELVSF